MSKYVKCMLVAMLLALTLTQNAQASTYSSSEILSFDVFRNNQNACYDFLKRFHRSHIDYKYGDGDSWKGNYTVHYKEDFGPRDGTVHEIASCRSDGSIRVKVKANRSFWDMDRVVTNFAGKVTAGVCGEYNRLSRAALKSGNKRQAKAYAQASAAITYKHYTDEVEGRSYDIEQKNCYWVMEAYQQRVDPRYKLTVRTQPGDARVRIMNIKEKYYPGIPIKAGIHSIEVSKPGYVTQRINLTMNPHDGHISVTLKRASKTPVKKDIPEPVEESSPGPASDFVSSNEELSAAISSYFLDNEKYPASISHLESFYGLRFKSLGVVDWTITDQGYDIRLYSTKNKNYQSHLHLHENDLDINEIVYSDAHKRDLKRERSDLKKKKMKKTCEKGYKVMKTVMETGKFKGEVVPANELEKARLDFNRDCAPLKL